MPSLTDVTDSGGLRLNGIQVNMTPCTAPSRPRPPEGFVRRLDSDTPSFTIDPAKVAQGSPFNALASLDSLLHFSRYVRGDLVDLGFGSASHRVWHEERVDTATLVDWPSSFHDTLHVDVLADINNPLPLDDASADTVLMTSVLEHLHSPATALAEARRILRPGGTLLLQVPFLYRVHEEPHDYFRYTRYGLRALLEQSGLRVVAGEAYGNLVAVLVDLAAKGGVNLAGAVASHLPERLASRTRRYCKAILSGAQLQAFCLLARPGLRRRTDRLGGPEQFPLGYTVAAAA